MALFMVLGSLATSCQKEHFAEPQTTMEQSEDLYVVHYTVDGTTYIQTLNSEEEYDALLRQLLQWAREGKRVRFYDSNRHTASNATKDILHYDTTNENDAITWCKERADEGFEVEMEYDPVRGIYHCTATK